MVRINLLPSYVLEPPRIWTVVIIFVVLAGIMAGGFVAAANSAKGIEHWYADDTLKFQPYKVAADNAKTDAQTVADNASKYTQYIKFFSYTPDNEEMKYLNDLAAVLEEASTKVAGNSGTWYTSMTISGTTVNYTGEIIGLTNFTHFYVNMKKAGFTVTPDSVQLKPTENETMTQQIDITLSGTLKNALPTEPSEIPGAQTPDTLFTPAAAAAAPAPGTPAPGAPGTPTTGAPGTPTTGAPGTPTTGAAHPPSTGAPAPNATGAPSSSPAPGGAT